MKRQLQIPVELAHIVFQKGIVPEFKVLIAAKYITPGSFSKKSLEFKQICEYVGNDSRTVIKHLNHLVRLGWIGIDWMEQKYYIRSWDWFYDQQIFSDRRAARFSYEDMDNFRAFLAGTVINNKVIKHIHWCNSQKRKLSTRDKLHLKVMRKRNPRKSVVSNNGCTTSQDQSVPSSSNRFVEPDYFGLSNYGISELLSCSESNARNLKHEAEAAGYLKTNGKFAEFLTVGKPNYQVRSELYRVEEYSFVKKLRYTSVRRDGKKLVLLVQQLHDEIIPMIEFSQIKYPKRISRKINKNKKSFLAGQLRVLQSLVDPCRNVA